MKQDMFKLFVAKVLLLLSLGVNTSAASDPQHRTILVLDASGSMWGQINNEAKILIARRVIDDLFGNWPVDSDMGLLVYGHRKEKDCNDIETLIPVSQLNKSHATDLVNGIKPLGKTPLTAAVDQAATHLSGADGAGKGGMIILLTDGLETCAGDPCALGKKLAAAEDVDFKVHVVGFDLQKENTGALQCLAQQTGGQYFPAEDAESLKLAFENATKNIAQETNLTLRAVDASGQLLPEKTHLSWSIHTLDTKPRKVAMATGVEIALVIAPGKYQVRGAQGEDASTAIDIQVPDNKALTQDVVFANGEIHLTAHLADHLPAVDDVIFNWEVFQDESRTKRVAKEAGKTAKFVLPAGQYFAMVSAEDLKVPFNFTIAGSKVAEQKLTLDAGRIATEGPSGTSWMVYQKMPDGQRKRAASEARASTVFLLSSAVYEVEGKQGKNLFLMQVDLGAGGRVDVEAVFSK